ncbi:MAG: hypothetical protein ACREAZ_10825, partial [Nitrososphaera sp.]
APTSSIMAENSDLRLEKMAAAIEDLIQMGALRLSGEKGEKALLSPQFSLVVSNVLSDMKIGRDAERDQVMKMMYYSLLIYMSEYLNIPKSLTMAFGNDLEKNRESMESGELVTTYVSVLAELWAQNARGSKG